MDRPSFNGTHWRWFHVSMSIRKEVMSKSVFFDLWMTLTLTFDLKVWNFTYCLEKCCTSWFSSQICNSSTITGCIYLSLWWPWKSLKFWPLELWPVAISKSKADRETCDTSNCRACSKLSFKSSLKSLASKLTKLWPKNDFQKKCDLDLDIRPIFTNIYLPLENVCHMCEIAKQSDINCNF